MPSVAQAVLRSWSIPAAATFAIVLSALVYLRGWWLLRSAGSPDIPPWRAISFLLGLFTVWVALASPMDVFNGLILTAHMLQHMLLMMVAPPLVLLGAPLVPMVRGLPVFAAREFAGPFLNWTIAKRVGSALTHPVFALLLMGATMFAWHTPALYEMALRSSSWHQVEHACFFLTSIIFWWPVVQPWPSRARWPRWAMVPYLLIADLQNTALSAILTFSDRVLYPSYSLVPRLFGLSALEDQAAAGAMMWVVGSLAFVVPAVVIAIHCLSRKSPGRESTATIQRDTSVDVSPTLLQRIPLLSGLMHRSSNRRAVEMSSFLVLFVVAGLCLARLSASGSDDDDQVLRLTKTSGSFAVAVFAPAGDIAVGPSSFSVLVQDRNTAGVLLDTTVELNAHPAASLSPSATSQASHEDSENKVLQSGELNLPATGDWLLNVVVRRNSETADFSLPLRVVKEEAAIPFPWSYAGFLTFAAILLLTYFRRHHGPGEHRLQESSAAVFRSGRS